MRNLPLEAVDIQFGDSGMDFYLKKSANKEEKLPFPKDLTGFRKIAEDTLVSLAERDLWQISEDGQFIERLFDGDGAPLKMPEPPIMQTQKASSKTATSDEIGKQAKEIILLLESAPGKSIRTSAEVAREIARVDQGINFRYLKGSDNKFRILRKGADDEANPPDPAIQTIEDLKAPIKDQIENALADPDLTVSTLQELATPTTADFKSDKLVKDFGQALKDLQEHKSTEKSEKSEETKKLLKNIGDTTKKLQMSSVEKKAIELEVVGPNQTKIFLGTKTIFFSYNTPVAYYDIEKKQYFVTNKKYSNTTTRHINNFLAGVKATPVDQSVLDQLS